MSLNIEQNNVYYTITCLNAQVTTIEMSATLLEIDAVSFSKLTTYLVDYDWLKYKINIITNCFLNSSGGH